MSLDQVENFIRVSVAGTHTSGASTISLETGEASELPPVTNGKYNLVWYDDLTFAQPDADPDVELVRVNSIDTTNDTISVTRGVENTSATAKDTNTGYELLLTPTAKTIEDIDSTKLDVNQRYTDSEASDAAPVQSVNTRTGDVSIPPTVNRVNTGKVLIDTTGDVTVSSIPFEPNEIQFHAEAFTPSFNHNTSGQGRSDASNYAGSSNGFARKDGASIDQQSVHSGGSGNSINQTGHFSSDSDCFAIRYSGQNGELLGFTRGELTSFNSDGFTISATVESNAEPVVLLYTAYRTGAVTENLSEISHTALTDISSDDHHSKTSGASELTDVSPDSTSSAHHSKTSSASELTDVSADSSSSAHHSRYSDEEAQDAVGGIVRNGLNYNDSSDLIEILAGNALTIDGNGNIDVVESNISHDNISGVSSSDHHSKTSSASELTDVSPDSTSGAHHSRYSDSEARTAVDGANVSITGDADTVDGFEATDLARPKNVAVLTSTDTSTDINQGSHTPIPFDKELQVDAGFSHSNSTNPEQLIFTDPGTYKIIASLSFSGGGSRNNPSVQLSLNGTILNPRGASGYMRNAEGHDEASSDVFEVLTVNSGDTLRVETIQQADGGTVTLRSEESRLIVEQVSETVARSEDADTVDGKHAADFASDNHGNSQHSTNFDNYGGFTYEEGDGENRFINSNDKIIVSGGTDINTELVSGKPGVNIEVSHNNTSSQGNVSLNNGDAISSVNLDGRGHVTSLSTQSVNHDSIAGVSSTDHHTRYSDSEARTAVDGSSVSLNHDNLTGVSTSDHHSKTSSASELTDVSPDSTSGAHHSRYSDSEARGSINDSTIRPKRSIHSRTIDSNLTLTSDDGLVLAGPISGSGSISGSGRFSVL